MPAKQKASTKKTGLEAIAKDQRQERKMITDMARRERIMKWLLIGIAILLLLLILFLGYATDWLKGISKDDTVGTTGISTANDAATTPNSTASGTTGTDSTGTTSTGTNTNGTSSTRSNTGTSSTNNTGTNSSNTSKETSNTSTTTNNNTTTNNTTTPAASSGLLSLYADSSVGDNISSLLDNASLLGVSKNCHTEVLIQVCDFTDGNATITTKNLLGTGLITSITKDF